MKKYEGILICSDYDNTICTEGRVSRENIRAINYFVKEGGLFTLATGRQQSHIDNANIGFECNAPAILINGTIVSEKGRILYSNPMEKDSLKVLYEILENYPFMNECNLRTYGESTIYKKQNGKMELISKAEGEYYKYIFLFDTPALCEEFMNIMIEKYGEDYEFVRSWPFEAEMLKKGSGKGDAVRFLRKYYGERIKKIVCVGDYENDISMLKEADLGIAVANALPKVKEAADLVTVSCDENAMEKIIYML